MINAGLKNVVIKGYLFTALLACFFLGVSDATAVVIGTMDVRMQPLTKTNFGFGEEIIFSTVFKNISDDSIVINDPIPEYGVSELRLTDGAGKEVVSRLLVTMVGPRRIAIESQREYISDYSLLGRRFPNFLAPGSYRAELSYRGIRYGVASFTVNVPSQQLQKKYQDWLLVQYVGSRRQLVRTYDDFFKKHPYNGDPVSIQAAGYYADALVHLGKPAEAIAYLSNKFSQDNSLRELQANIYHKMGNLDSAIDTILPIDKVRATNWAIEKYCRQGLEVPGDIESGNRFH